ncbi:hypothetical protein TNCV_3872651 [Trichonephila clavipes]|nr:hypothetical protein TNCV_3872651 [Trichonephila clavipes]
MENVDDQSFIPINLGRVEEERIPPGREVSQIYLESGKWRRIDYSDVVREDVASLMIARSSQAFVFLKRPDPPRR